MDYKIQNDETRNYFKQDFSEVKNLLIKLRQCLTTGEKADFDVYNKDKIINYDGSNHIFVTLFQEFIRPIRYGGRKKTFSETINRIIEQLRNNSRFSQFEVGNSKKTRILFEYITKKTKVDVNKLHTGGKFDETRIEPGISGLMMAYEGSYITWLPSDSATKSEMTIRPILTYLADKSGIGKEEKLSQDEKIYRLKKLSGAEFYIIESNKFITLDDEIYPLYRDNILFNEFDYNLLLKIFNSSANWLIDNLIGGGQFTYYYNPTKDDNIDHEHPKKRPPNLYYNDLRHAGGIITLLRKYELSGDKKWLNIAKECMDWTTRQVVFHKDPKNRDAAYVFANRKAKLGGVGLPLIAFMRYRMLTSDTSYDKYIEGFVRHLLMRLTPDGEFLGYYIHPHYNNGEALLELNEQEKKETFSFYYPGEALMGLGMFVNHFCANEELKNETIEKAKIAMHWIVEDRPLLYKEQFTALPSDAWLMQAIEEWADVDGFLEQSAIDFVFNDAQTMIDKTYKKDDSPYIDYQGGMYYKYGDHYFPDGARCEGLIGAYYLAKKLKMEAKANEILEAAKICAKCQFQLFISSINNYHHKNPARSEGGIKFKVTRQWIRVDSIEHVACFFIRLYFSEHKKTPIQPNY